MRFAAALCLVVACGPKDPPAHRRVRPIEHPDAPLPPLNASADREHPVELSDDRHEASFDSGKVAVRTPGRGSWWFAVSLSPAREGMSGELHIHLDDSSVRIFLDASDSRTGGGQRIDLADPGAGRFLVRVETDRARDFELGVTRSWLREPPPQFPACDRNAIAPANPNCRGVYPRCDLNRPDFKNPSCCQAQCMLGAMQCTAKVIHAPDGPRSSLAEIDIGADKEIMSGARATIDKAGKLVATGTVLAVAEHTASVALDRIEHVDVAKLLGAHVTLVRPAECVPHP